VRRGRPVGRGVSGYLDVMASQQLAGEWVSPADEKAARAAEREKGRRALLRVADQHRAVAEDLDDAVRAARAAGCSWGTIGRALGITRQSAHERYAGRFG
jgi:hypothetical protein